MKSTDYTSDIVPRIRPTFPPVTRTSIRYSYMFIHFILLPTASNSTRTFTFVDCRELSFFTHLSEFPWCPPYLWTHLRHVFITSNPFFFPICAQTFHFIPLECCQITESCFYFRIFHNFSSTYFADHYYVSLLGWMHERTHLCCPKIWTTPSNTSSLSIFCTYLSWPKKTRAKRPTIYGKRNIQVGHLKIFTKILNKPKSLAYSLIQVLSVLMDMSYTTSNTHFYWKTWNII